MGARLWAQHPPQGGEAPGEGQEHPGRGVGTEEDHHAAARRRADPRPAPLHSCTHSQAPGHQLARGGPGGRTHGICGGTGRTRRTGGCPRNQAILGVAKGRPDPPSKAAGVSPPPAAQLPGRGVGTKGPFHFQWKPASGLLCLTLSTPRIPAQHPRDPGPAPPDPGSAPPGPRLGAQSITLMVPHPWGHPWELPVGDGDWKAPSPPRGTAEHWAALAQCQGLTGSTDSVPTLPQTCPCLPPAATSQTPSQLSEGREGPCPPGPPTPAVLDAADRVTCFGAQTTPGAVT